MKRLLNWLKARERRQRHLSRMRHFTPEQVEYLEAFDDAKSDEDRQRVIRKYRERFAAKE